MASKQEEAAYTICTDSHHRAFLKEEGYGFIAQVAWNDAPLGEGWHRFERDGDFCAVQLLPLNRGCDLSVDELHARLQEAVDAQ